MVESICRVGNSGRIMSVPQFIRWVRHNLRCCDDKFVFLTTDWEGRALPPTKSHPCLRIPIAWDGNGFSEPQRSQDIAHKSVNFGVIVLTKDEISKTALENIRARRGLRAMGGRSAMSHHDEKIAKRNAGKVLSKEAVLRLFGYAPSTYIFDTAVKSKGLIVQLHDGSFKVVSPDV
jgi:hypothetical protein